MLYIVEVILSYHKYPSSDWFTLIFFASPRDQCIKRAENVRRLSQKRGKKLGYQIDKLTHSFSWLPN